MNRIYNIRRIDKNQLLFSTKDIWKLLIPLIAEQMLNSFMGLADTMMVSRVGQEAISAVSLVDSINMLILQVFAAMSTGAAIICSQFIGKDDKKMCNEAARQIVFTVTMISAIIMLVCIIFRKRLLLMIFGQVDNGVMNNAQIYFLLTAFSYPFIALFNAGSAFYRAGGNSKLPMGISLISNIMNIAGNAILIFIFNMGVCGAAVSTLVSRAFCSIAVFICLRKPGQLIEIRNYLSIRPDWKLIIKILSIGVPAGIENGMFQFGKLAIQSTVSTLGTTAIAAQAMTIIFENVNGVASCGVAIGLMTVIGQAVGAGRKEEAKYYVIKFSGYAYIAMILSCILVYLAARPVTVLAGMTLESQKLCLSMVLAITIVKPVIWVPSFVPPYAFRAAGDVKFTMIVSSCSMWLCRVAFSIFFIRFCKTGPIGMWYGMFIDWSVRAVIYSTHFIRGKWLDYKVV